MSQKTTMEEFESLLEQDEFLPPPDSCIVKGTVIAIEGEQAIIDTGHKTEGRVNLKEFAPHGEVIELAVGDKVDVYLERGENARGEAIISHDKALREASWDNLEKAFDKKENVVGIICNRVKGGFTVDLDGAIAFLPGSQVDLRPVRDATPLIGTEQPFQILTMNRRRNNIVVSRRSILEESQAEARAEVMNKLNEGDIVEGFVKNITDYGTFVDLGGVDGLVHITDLSWSRVNHPSEVVNIGDPVTVKVIKINREAFRLSLGLKQLKDDPWKNVQEKYPLRSIHTGRVANIADYGAFVELEPGIEGLVHLSEMSWTRKNIHPGKIVSTSQQTDVMILDIDVEKRRISLGIKQTTRKPWDTFAETYPPGSVIEGEVKNITEFGLFLGLENDIDGMVHLSDLSWDERGEDVIKKYHKGQIVKAIVNEVDVDKERISLSIKALNDTFTQVAKTLKRGQVITVQITDVQESKIEVEYKSIKSFIRRSDLSRSRSEQTTERFAVGNEIDVKVTSVDLKNRQLGLSIKALEITEEKKIVEQYTNADSAASSLGDILGQALKQSQAAASSENNDSPSKLELSENDKPNEQVEESANKEEQAEDSLNEDEAKQNPPNVS